MSVSLNAICKHFSKNISHIYSNEENDIFFNNVKLLTNNYSNFVKETIYIGEASCLESLTDSLRGNTFLLVNNTGACCTDFASKGCNIIELENSQDILEIFNNAIDLFLKYNHENENTSKLLQSVFLGKGIDGILEIAASILDNPLIFIDSSYKVLAHSDINSIKDPLWIENLKNGYCTYDFIAGVKKLKSVEKGIKEDEVYEVLCTESSNMKLVSGVVIDGKHIGSIIMLISRNIYTSEEMKLLSLSSKIIGEEMKKNDFYRNADNVAYSELIYDLLENKIINSQMLKERAKSTDIKIGKNLAVLAIDIANYKSEKKYTSYLSNSLGLYFPTSNTIYYNDNVIIICDFDKFNKSSKNFNDFKKFLKANNITAAMSKNFSDILYCKKYYEQAIRALKIGESIGCKDECIFYSDIQLYDLISLTCGMFDYKEFYHPALLKLKQYDHENNSDLYNTLYVYLKNNQNLLKTSNELFTHRNTISYRIKRILELVDIDFSSSKDVFDIILSYKIMAYPKLFTNK